jgi:hypothetical protein
MHSTTFNGPQFDGLNPPEALKWATAPYCPAIRANASSDALSRPQLKEFSQLIMSAVLRFEEVDAFGSK